MSSHIRQSRLPIGAGEQFKSQFASETPRTGSMPARQRPPGSRPVIGAAVVRRTAAERAPAPESTEAVLPRAPQAMATLPAARATHRLPRWIGAVALVGVLVVAGLWTRGALVFVH